MNCVFCGKSINLASRVSRTDTCPHCKKDLRCCRQCRFYDPHLYNECREVIAERITDKERSNFCDNYVPIGSARDEVKKTEEAKRALEALFRK